MDSIIPVEIRTAIANAEKALAALKEDFALVEREAATVNDAAASSSSTAPLDTAIAALDEVDTAKCRVAASFALASLYYSLSSSEFFSHFCFLTFHSFLNPSQHEMRWSGAPHARRDEGACARPPVHQEVPDASPAHSRKDEAKGEQGQGEGEGQQHSHHSARIVEQGRQARTGQPRPRQPALSARRPHMHAHARTRASQ